MPRMSMELVVVAIVILIVALVVIGIFTGGMQNFTNIFGFQSDTQIKQSLCQTNCASYCFTHPPTEQKKTYGWGKSDGSEQGKVPSPQYKGGDVNCLSIYGGDCNCNK